MTRTRPPQQGLASLGIVLVMLVAASLVVLYANRVLIFEQRASANQVRAAQAFEAAEAGLEWGLAVLSHPGALDTTCKPTEAPATTPLLEQLQQAGRSANCLRATDGAWQCSCPGSPTWPTDLPPAQGFSLRVEAGPKAGSLALISIGCTHPSGPCTNSANSADAQAQVRTVAAPLPLLARPPAAALMAGGAITLGAGTLLSNAEPASGGVTAAAGGAITHDPATQLLSLPGRPGTASIAPADPSLQSAPLFTRILGLAPSTYRDLPGVLVLDCGSTCRARDISTAWAEGRQPVLWVEGAVHLDADLPLGSATAPLLLVVDGPLQLSGAQQPWGLLMARSIQWAHSSGGLARLRGALVVQDEAVLAGDVQVMFDASVLAALARLSTFVRAPGAWRDFE